MKGRFFWFALFLIGISWSMNTIYAHSKQLDEPIFLDHYIDTMIHEGKFLTFYYLANKNDISSVSHVNMGDVTGYVSNDEFNFGFNYDFDPNIDVFAHHAFRSFRVELNPIEFEDSLKDGPFTISEIDVYFNDGKIVTVPIGEITFHSDYPTDNVLDPRSSSGSNDGNSEYMYIVEQDHSIENISVDFENVLRNHSFIKINSTNRPTTNNTTQTSSNSDWNARPGVDIRDIKFPYKLEKGEKIYIYTLISPDFIGFLDSFIILSGTTESTNNFSTYIPLYSQQPYLVQKDVNNIIKEKVGGINR